MTGYPQILTNISILDNFLPDAVQMSNRAFSLAIMQSSTDFILNVHDKMSEEERKVSSQSKDKSRENLNKIISNQKERRMLGSLDSSDISYQGHPKMFSTEQKSTRGPILQDA